MGFREIFGGTTKKNKEKNILCCGEGLTLGMSEKELLYADFITTKYFITAKHHYHFSDFSHSSSYLMKIAIKMFHKTVPQYETSNPGIDNLCLLISAFSRKSICFEKIAVSRRTFKIFRAIETLHTILSF